MASGYPNRLWKLFGQIEQFEAISEIPANFEAEALSNRWAVGPKLKRGDFSKL